MNALIVKKEKESGWPSKILLRGNLGNPHNTRLEIFSFCLSDYDV